MAPGKRTKGRGNSGSSTASSALPPRWFLSENEHRRKFRRRRRNRAFTFRDGDGDDDGNFGSNVLLWFKDSGNAISELEKSNALASDLCGYYCYYFPFLALLFQYSSIWSLE